MQRALITQVSTSCLYHRPVFSQSLQKLGSFFIWAFSCKLLDVFDELFHTFQNTCKHNIMIAVVFSIYKISKFNLYFTVW